MSLPSTGSRVDCDTPKTPSASLRLLLELRKRASDSADGSVVAARSDLAKTLGVSERTIRRARADLAAAGFITVAGADQRYTPNTHHVLL